MGATGADLRRGQMSAWLQKKKSGSAMVRVRQYNKRYFTIDFDSRVFFYTHQENSKKVSSMIPFADLVDVKLPDSHIDKGDNASECSRQSRVSWMKRLGSGAKLGEEEHLLTLLTKPAKTMELLCSSAAEAVQWYEAFRAAIADRGDDEDGVEGSPCSIGAGTPSSGEGSKETPALDDPAGQSTTAVLAEASCDAAQTIEAPPLVKGTFLDLSLQPEASAPTQLPSAEEAAVQNLSPGKLDASQFGFDGEESGGSSAASSPPASPSSPGRPGPSSASGPHSSGPAAGRRSYADQHEGLSMQERLANLEFSDAEDDDDPLGLGTAKAS